MVQEQPWQKVSETPFQLIQLGMVVPGCNPSYTEGTGRRTMVQGQQQEEKFKILPEK
jgi:hypothetical protein